MIFKKVCVYLQTRGISMSPKDVQMISSVTGHRIIPKHTIVMHQGKIVKKLFFLNEGIVRLFRVHEGSDYTLGLVSANDFISTPLYLLNGELSSCALETLTDIEVLEWSKTDVEAIKKQVSKAYEIEQAIMHRLLSWLQDMQIDAVCLTAEERYQKLLQQQPEVVQTIPLKYIASFLGIHQDSLSRIRKQVIKRPD
ncbi:Crp/Fnr family transcriptional regulator [Olivibacter domesticus]|uniref:cAMP-binding domain of CRP or a regulatory subunit of cAMP-dependent protein kinases n=1 Tax=Olivibacter domesticus TaxID=407022 RepID=A0A1H7HEV4_OLID1|nr:Crp/Fnr family transcriptional regulator [Olivibacter domesticus]SEK48926.1 cAMP-binding domain of CRP or a regulatory subunit of cAMP-dependent protein kinases [Olivibacter domesticus]